MEHQLNISGKARDKMKWECIQIMAKVENTSQRYLSESIFTYNKNIILGKSSNFKSYAEQLNQVWQNYSLSVMHCRYVLLKYYSPAVIWNTIQKYLLIVNTSPLKAFSQFHCINSESSKSLGCPTLV